MTVISILPKSEFIENLSIPKIACLSKIFFDLFYPKMALKSPKNAHLPTFWAQIDYFKTKNLRKKNFVSKRMIFAKNFWFKWLEKCSFWLLVATMMLDNDIVKISWHFWIYGKVNSPWKYTVLSKNIQIRVNTIDFQLLRNVYFRGP